MAEKQKVEPNQLSLDYAVFDTCHALITLNEIVLDSIICYSTLLQFLKTKNQGYDGGENVNQSNTD